MEKKKKSVSFRERIEALKLAIKWTYNSSKPLTIAIFSVVIIGGLLTLVEPFVFRIIIDLLVDEQASLATKLGIGMIGILAIYAVSRVLLGVFWDVQVVIKKIHSQKLDKYVSSQMMSKVSSLDAVYFEDPNYYNTLQKANYNLWRVNDFFWQFSFFLGQFISVAVIIGALFTFNALIVLLIILAALPSILIIFKNTRIQWSIFDSFSPLSRQANYYRYMMMENPQAIKEIKLFDLKNYFLKKYDSLFAGFINEQERAVKKELGLLTIMGVIEGVFAVMAAWLVIRAFLGGEITIGQVIFYWTLLFQFAEHTRHMVRQLGTLNENSVFIIPFVKILEFKPQIIEAGNARKFPDKIREGIEFRNVTFYYPKAKKPALKNFSLLIKPGESIALVGENGSGKTTMIKLLTRLYDADEGEILIDGVNIKEYSLGSLYENIGVIFQDFMKYEALVGDNIGYGRLKHLGKSRRVHSASMKAEAWEFIRDLEKRYKTHLGKTLEEEGVELSVGQWQKIALARAFFKDAQILCLDEPTAAVDAKAEYQLFRKFEKLTKNKTAILISHRFSTVRMADKIVVIDKGRILEQGAHRDLLRKGGKYAKLFRMQAEGYKDYFELKL